MSERVATSVREGVGQIAEIFVTVMLALSLTYLVPVLSLFQPWAYSVGTLDDPAEPEPIPFQQWWLGFDSKPGKLPSFAGARFKNQCATDQAELAKELGVSETLLAEGMDLGAGDLGDVTPAYEPPPVEPKPVEPKRVEPKPVEPKPVEPKPVEPKPVEPKPVEPKPVEPKPVEPKPWEPPYVVEPSEWEGITQEIHDPTGKAMDAFYEQLLETALKKPGAITRISHWGDSVIGADGATSWARLKMWQRFGSAGRGWVNMTPGWEWYRQQHVKFKPKAWKDRNVASHHLKGDRYVDSRYGFGGVAAQGYAGSKTTYTVNSRRLELYYLAFPKGGEVTVKIDGGEPTRINTQSEEVKDAWQVVEAEKPGEHTFEVRALGRTHLYGVTLEDSGPGVVYDCIAMIGTRASRILNYNAEHLKTQVAHRNPNLQIFMFGGNEVHDKGSLRKYEQKYDQAIKRLRAGASNASCLVMTPIDHGEKYRGRIRTIPRLKKMIPVQKRLAEANGCGFYDTWAAMGGDGSIGRWKRQGFAWADYAHLTSKGDPVLGVMIYKALIKGFADFIERSRP